MGLLTVKQQNHLHKMTNSRRNFCKKAVYIGLGLSFLPSITHAKTHETISKKVLILTKNAQKVVKVNGQVRYKDLSPVKNATIEIWHNNSESNPSKFEYEGKLTTDSEGNYSLETDFPEKHFEDGYAKICRIHFKIKDQNGEGLTTKLYFGVDDKAFVDCIHFSNTPESHRLDLPKTNYENSIIQFNIYLNS
jgi:protocatechuate 3,4-dioxygenase beta subunit